MTTVVFPLRENTLSDDALLEYPDAGDQIVIDAVRTWFRPQCDAVRGKQSWQEVLGESGLTLDGVGCFELLMSVWVRTAGRALDIRCRCSGDLASDEACLLQAIACFQSNEQAMAKRLLSASFALYPLEQLCSVAHWFGLALLNAGITLRNRARRVTYIH